MPILLKMTMSIFYISNKYSGIGADLWNETVGAADTAPTLRVFMEVGWVGRVVQTSSFLALWADCLEVVKVH